MSKRSQYSGHFETPPGVVQLKQPVGVGGAPYRGPGSNQRSPLNDYLIIPAGAKACCTTRARPASDAT